MSARTTLTAITWLRGWQGGTAVTIAVRLSDGSDATATASDPDGPVRLRYSATGLPVAELTSADRAILRERIGRALAVRIPAA